MPPVSKKEMKKGYSAAAAIQILFQHIRAMQDRGYTVDQISEILGRQGLFVKSSSMKCYMKWAKRKVADQLPAKMLSWPLDFKCYTTEQIEAIAAKLDEMPPTEYYVVQKALNTLASEIFAIKERGYKDKQILDVLQRSGLQVTASDLKNHLQRTRDVAKRKDADLGR